MLFVRGFVTTVFGYWVAKFAMTDEKHGFSRSLGGIVA